MRLVGYRHVIGAHGELIDPDVYNDRIRDSGIDPYDIIEQMYGMIWWLADQKTLGDGPRQWPDVVWTVAEWVERARQSYERGLSAARRETAPS
jgi:hypothetical protein